MGKNKDRKTAPPEIEGLGELGGTVKIRPAVPFTYFGKKMHTNPLATELHLVEFLARLEQVDIPYEMDINDPATWNALSMEDKQRISAALFALLPSVRRFLASVVDPGDFPVLWQTALDKGQEGLDLLGLCMTLLNASTSSKGEPVPPTSARPVSLVGRARTGKKSEFDSMRQVIHDFEQEGRSDLAEGVQLRLEALGGSVS